MRTIDIFGIGITEDQIIQLLQNYGLIIVFIGAVIEGETILLLAGLLIHQGILSFPYTVIVAALGAVVGDQIWFHVGKHFGERILLRFPHLEYGAKKIRPWLSKRADLVAVGNRFIYGARTAAPVLLGTNNYPSGRFLFINVIAGSIWAFLITGTGYLLGLGAEKLLGDIINVEKLIILVVLIMIAFYWYRHHNIKKKTKQCRSR